RVRRGGLVGYGFGLVRPGRGAVDRGACPVTARRVRPPGKHRSSMCPDQGTSIFHPPPPGTMPSQGPHRRAASRAPCLRHRTGTVPRPSENDDFASSAGLSWLPGRASGRTTPVSAVLGRRVPMKPLEPSDPRTIGGIEVHGRLGEGGMGVVYFGVTPDAEQVAVKVIKDDLAGQASLRERFDREVLALGMVHGPRVAGLVAAAEPTSEE